VTTPLPEPIVKLHGKEKGGKLSASSMDLYTPDQMRAYGAAEYKRGTEALQAVTAERDALKAGIEKLASEILGPELYANSPCQASDFELVSIYVKGLHKERDAEIERLKGPVPEDTISNQRTIQDNPRSAIGIMQRQNKKIAAQRKVLEQAISVLLRLKRIEGVAWESSSHKAADKAITAIKEVLHAN